MYFYQIEQIRRLEKLASEHFAISGTEMMQRAGQAAFNILLQRWPAAKRIAVFCGRGNNGGDGRVLAALATAHGLAVQVFNVGAESLAADMTVTADVIVDAICGIGLQGPVRQPVAAVIASINRSCLPVLALDTPSGLDVNTGVACGAVVHATLTITFIGLKLGLMTGAGPAYCGEVICEQLQLPAALFAAEKPIATQIHLNNFLDFLAPRPRNYHKGQCGRVLIIGGDYGYSGAVRLAGEAALRTGAGVVTIATRPEHAYSLNANRPELMCRGLTSAAEVQALLGQADVTIIGPGLGRSNWASDLLDIVLSSSAPLVIDADALYFLPNRNLQRENWLLTPHPGEAAHLLGVSTTAVQSDRLAHVLALQKKYHGAVVLKGAGSLIATMSAAVFLCGAGNPGMATAGMGDVLCGVLAALLGQGVPLDIAAQLGVCLHASAGDVAAKLGERGTIASDVIGHLQRLVNP